MAKVEKIVAYFEAPSLENTEDVIRAVGKRLRKEISSRLLWLAPLVQLG